MVAPYSCSKEARNSDGVQSMDLREFFQSVVTSPPGEHEGWFNLSFAPPKGQGWYEEWFRWPDDLERALDLALTRAEDSNVYFSSYLFGTPNSNKSEVLRSRTIQADLDDADILTLPIQPSVLVETSAGRHQGYWFLSEALEPDVHEILSRKLTYSIKDADTSGWPLGRKVRVPFTFNYKYLEGAQQVNIISSSLKVYNEEDLELLEEPPAFLLTREDVSFLDTLSESGIRVGNAIGPQELFAGVQHKLPASVRTQFNVRQQDRSKALWALMCALFRAGVTREEVWHLAWNSQNNKFLDLKFHCERELAKDVLRAETSVKSKVVDERSVIAEARRLPGATHERRQHLLSLVLGFLRSAGDFIHTADDLSWYIRHDLGRPILITPHSEWLDMILDLQFGLNGTEQDKQYVAVGLANFCRSLPINGIQQSLSYYDPNAKHLLLHTGRKDVLRITATNTTKSTDGSYGVVFPWSVSNESFLPKVPASGSDPDLDWAQTVFGGALDNLLGVDPDDALALLRVWLLFLLFRSTAVSRPILAAFGQPGAGKSTLFRRIYRLLYGRSKSVLKITSAENFDMALATDPFIVADNVDSPDKWLPDRLALAASTSDIPKRKLYTDADEYVLKCQAVVGITAHNPRFTREDVSDRLILLTFKRLEHFLPEGDLLDRISRERNRIWGAIVTDCQRVLQTPQPRYADVPQFRVEDFARTGYWIASALGITAEFASALKAVSRDAKQLNLNEDQVLVDTIRAFIASGKGSQKRRPAQLWSEFQLCSPDVHSFMKLYRGAVYLGKKLLVLQDSLKEIFEIEVENDRSIGERFWKFGLKDGQEPYPTSNGVLRTPFMGSRPGGSTK